jgi:glutamate--cysteine ligase
VGDLHAVRSSGGDAAVPIARYGSSHQGRIKTIYRHGLLVRYGGMMQAISGVHFNYSVPEQFWPLYAEVSASPRRRPGFRLGALLRPAAQLPAPRLDRVYLFGVSPALCRRSCRAAADPELEPLGPAR